MSSHTTTPACLSKVHILAITASLSCWCSKLIRTGGNPFTSTLVLVSLFAWTRDISLPSPSLVLNIPYAYQRNFFSSATQREKAGAGTKMHFSHSFLVDSATCKNLPPFFQSGSDLTNTTSCFLPAKRKKKERKSNDSLAYFPSM